MQTGRGKHLTLVVATLAVVVLGVAAWLSWPQLQFWWLFEPLGRNAQGLPEYRHRQTGIVMVRLPGGTFWMGAQKEDPNGQNYDPEAAHRDGPVHQVTLSPFLIAKCEVTQAEWTRVMGSNPSWFKGDDLPVEMVSWDDCQEFCLRTGLVLPSEAQWEYACRGGSAAPYCFGADAKLFSEYAWYVRNSNSTSHRVGEKRPNGFGLHDVHGNVWEWVEDAFDDESYGRAEAGGLDPVSRAGSGVRVNRGGGWANVATNCLSALRGGSDPVDRDELLGLRPACPLP